MRQNNEDIGYDKVELVTTLHASLLTFTRFFFKILSGRDFLLSDPPGRESHFVTVCREFTSVFREPNQRLMINMPPGYGKSTLASYFTAWAMARYPFSQFIYISCGKDLAVSHTENIRRIIQLPEYKELFGVEIDPNNRGKESFKTTDGGAVAGFGSQSLVTGRNAGHPQMECFSGCIIMDDMHKPDEVHSDTVRNKVILNYQQTIEQRLRGINVPIIYIGQRLHESDLCSFLLDGGDGHEWRRVILQAIDAAGNPLYPEKDPLDKLRIKEEVDIYTFASQYQQDPQPAGGSLFKPEMFPLLDKDPDMMVTFITADTAESTKSYSDYTAFSFWGLYEIEFNGHKTGEYGIHWIDCIQVKVEPKEMEDVFFTFWGRCQTHKTPPSMVAIEKKSAGVTLLSVLSDLRGIEVRNIERTAASGSKSDRFLSMQHYIAKKLISLNKYAPYAELCVEHMKKITANNTHAHDDICDTAYDALKIALMDKTLLLKYNKKSNEIISKALVGDLQARIAAKRNSYYE